MENHSNEEREGFINQEIMMTDITEEVKAMPEGQSFITVDQLGMVKPAYAAEIRALFLIMNWPLFSKIPHHEATSKQGLSLYAALIPHGKTHIVECFFSDEATGRYMGTHKAFSLTFPENIYVEEYDDWLMDEVANRVLGIKQDESLAHKLLL